MNYFAHGRPFLDDPYFMAGTAVPDWLNVVDRRMKVRSKHAEPFAGAPDPQLAALARGILQHHQDDHRFHQNRAFVELNFQVAGVLRQSLREPPQNPPSPAVPSDATPPDRAPRFHPFFVGHVVVEMLLDAILIDEHPGLLDRYYETMERLDHGWLQTAINRMASRTSDRLAGWIGLFCRERFLYDYAQDEKLLARLNRVLQRVGLLPLPPRVLGTIAAARRDVRRRLPELIACNANC